MQSIKHNIPKLDHLKYIVSSSTETIGNAFASINISEPDFLSQNEKTDKEIISLLVSKMNMEVVLGLKKIMNVNIYFNF